MSEKAKTAKETIDPVCGMTVSENSEYRYFYKDQAWFFCGKPCLLSFAQDPEKYVKKTKK